MSFAILRSSKKYFSVNFAFSRSSWGTLPLLKAASACSYQCMNAFPFTLVHQVYAASCADSSPAILLIGKLGSNCLLTGASTFLNSSSSAVSKGMWTLPCRVACPWGAGVLSGLPPLAVVPTWGFAIGCLPLSLFPSTWVCPPEGRPLCNPDRVTCPQGGRIVSALPLVALVPTWGHAS